jgi:protein SCO1
MRLKAWIVFAALLGLMAAGCAKKADEPERPARRYPLKGKVVSLDQAKKQVVVAHEEIKEFMEAMTMPFDLKDDWPLGVLAPGQSITATLVVGGGKSWLEEIVVTDAPSQAAPEAGAGGTHDPAPGAVAPGIALVNQDGRKVKLSDYKGRFLLVTFIYTRCPLPDYCPRMGEYFDAVLKSVESDPALADKVRLLSVSFDPEFDTPRVLRDYGVGWLGARGAAGFQYWEFASGSQEEIKNLSQFFGLSYWRETNQIVHSLRTALIGPDGKLAVLYRGNEWKPEEVIAEIRRRI